MDQSRVLSDVSLSREIIHSALKPVIDPASRSDIVAANIIDDLVIDDDGVRLVLTVDPSFAAEMEAVRAAAEKRISAVAGRRKVTVILTAHSDAPSATTGPDDDERSHESPRENGAAGPETIPGIDRIIAVASGKGGVGKSTVAANLACALALGGHRVGLLDADVYGPSQPRMLGISGRPASPDGQMILPLRGHGVTLMSIGLLAEEGEAVAWRGPMLMGALQQMLSKVQWGALDALLVDLPPGTGDVQMTLAQTVRVDGAIVVSTPQDIALLDARKGIDMFRQMNVPIFGLIENMSSHICSKCGHEEHIFGHGGVKAEAEKLDVPLLGTIPLLMDIRTASDDGTPIVISMPESAAAAAFSDIASKIIKGEVK
ncbi:MAG: P-loop NTPase [Rhizobiaceae bacterium]